MEEMKRPLPFDTSRCSGRFDFEHDGKWCEHKDTCARYLSFVYWDKGKVPDYRGIAVHMAMDDCTQRIEVEA